jgi:hypothetical protein
VNIKINADINSNGSWLLTFIAVNAYAWGHSVPFSEYWVPAAALFGWHSGRRLWRELKLPGTTIVNDPADPVPEAR